MNAHRLVGAVLAAVMAAGLAGCQTADVGEHGFRYFSIGRPSV